MPHKQIYFKPSQRSDKIYSGVIWVDNGDFITVGKVKDSKGYDVVFPPLMLNSKVIHKDFIINKK